MATVIECSEGLHGLVSTMVFKNLNDNAIFYLPPSLDRPLHHVSGERSVLGSRGPTADHQGPVSPAPSRRLLHVRAAAGGSPRAAPEAAGHRRHLQRLKRTFVGR